MTMTLQIVFLFVSISILIFVIYKIRKSQLQIADAIVWITGSVLLIFFSVFSELVMKVSRLIGFYSTSNFILTMFVFFLLVIAFTQNIKISTLNEKVKNLNHYIALRDKDMQKEQDEEKKRLEK